jgi:hypothetical protein
MVLNNLIYTFKMSEAIILDKNIVEPPPISNTSKEQANAPSLLEKLREKAS